MRSIGALILALIVSWPVGPKKQPIIESSEKCIE